MNQEHPNTSNPATYTLTGLPKSWSVKKLKYVADILFSNVDKKTNSEEIPVELCNYVDVYYNDFITKDITFMKASATEAEIARFTIFKEDILITKDSETPDDIAIPAYVSEEFEGVLCGYHLAHIRPYKNSVDGRFLFRVFSAIGLRDQFHVAANGVTRFGLSKYWIDNALLPIPPLSEQKSIADFLDRETERIDTLIAKKERQIELLQEKRSSLITQAVTKGLDPDVKMKDSEIEWLGEIPEHWEVIAAKRYSIRIQTGSTPPSSEERYYEDGTVKWYGPSSFGIDILLTKPVKLINKCSINEGKARLFNAGSTMIVGIGATIGKVGYIEEDSSSNQQITCITPDKKKLNGIYLAYHMKSMEKVFRGIAPITTLPIMDQSQIGSFKIAVPPFVEQGEIVAHIEAASKKIDNLNNQIRISIDKLHEYRSALISAAVTGKIDVTKEAA